MTILKNLLEFIPIIILIIYFFFQLKINTQINDSINDINEKLEDLQDNYNHLSDTFENLKSHIDSINTELQEQELQINNILTPPIPSNKSKKKDK